MKLVPFSRFVVSDRSMLPIYCPGEHVLTFNWTFPKIGDVVVFRERNRFFIKRVITIKKDEQSVLVCGDNKKGTSKFGPVRLQQIVGKVLFGY